MTDTPTPNDNSYITNADALTYFDNRLGYDSWPLLTSTKQDQALLSAFPDLNLLCDWYGWPTDPNQLGAFPRGGDTEVPQSIIDAQCEIAYAMASAGTTDSIPEDVLTRLKAGDVELGFKGVGGKTGGLYTDYTRSLLRDYGSCHYSTGTKQVDVLRG